MFFEPIPDGAPKVPCKEAIARNAAKSKESVKEERRVGGNQQTGKRAGEQVRKNGDVGSSIADYPYDPVARRY